MEKAKQKWIQSKIRRINKEGIRGKEPVKGQAYAVAMSMYKKRSK